MASEHRRAVGIFPDRPRTASALQALHDSGFAMSHVSVIAKDSKQQTAIAGVNVKDEVTNHADTGGAVGAVTGGVLGGVTGLLVGLGTLTIPGLGPALLAGEAAAVLSTLVGGAAGAVAGGLLGALIGMGVPEHRAKRYRDRVAAGDYLVMLKGTDAEIARAERTLKDSGIEDWGVYSAPAPQERTSDHEVNPFVEHSEAASPSATYSDRDQPNRLSESTQMGFPNTLRADGDSLDPTSERTAAVATSGPFTSGPSINEPTEQRAIGIFQDQGRLESALAQLKQTGFPMHILSVMVRDVQSGMPEERRVRPGNPLLGATSLTSGLSHIDLPHIGSILAMGPDVDSISRAANSSTDGGAGVLKELGIADESAQLYSRHLSEGAYLVTLKGRSQDVLPAASTLGQYGMRDWGIYDVRR